MSRNHRLDVIAIVSMIAGLGGSTTLPALGLSVDALAPGWGKKVVAVLSIAAFAAGLILRTRTANSATALAATLPFPDRRHPDEQSR
jgi:hypothetical protein